MYNWLKTKDIPGQYEDAVVGGQPYENAICGTLHLWPAEDEDGQEVADEAEDPDPVEEDGRHEELEDKVDL